MRADSLVGRGHAIRCGRVSGLVMRRFVAAGLYGDMRIASLSGLRAFWRSGRCRFWRSRLVDPNRATDVPHLPSTCSHHRCTRRPPARAAAGALQVVSRTLGAQTVRAILLANTTTTTMRSFFPIIIRASHDPCGGPLRAAPLRAIGVTTADAPMSKRWRMSRWPIFEVFPSRVLPPVEGCFGVKPSQAAQLVRGGSRPLWNAAMPRWRGTGRTPAPR